MDGQASMGHPSGTKTMEYMIQGIVMERTVQMQREMEQMICSCTGREVMGDGLESDQLCL